MVLQFERAGNERVIETVLQNEKVYRLWEWKGYQKSVAIWKGWQWKGYRHCTAKWKGV